MTTMHPTLQLPRELYRRGKSMLRWLARPMILARRRARWMAWGEKWVVNVCDVNGRDVSLEGWAIAPAHLRRQAAFTCAGQIVIDMQYPKERPGVAAAFPLAPDALWSGFAGRCRLPRPLQPGDSVEITLVNRTTGQPLAPGYAPHFFRLPRHDDPPFPETARRIRVINQTADDYFRQSGYSQYRRLEWAMRRATGKTYAECKNILDWGCGCGRVIRYFDDRPAGTFVGADVDADNIAWCKANLRGSFETIPLHPPTRFANGTFDLVFGISVFTHLREQDQDDWLQEIVRITRPGATVLLSVHGDTTLYRNPLVLSEEQKQARKRDGFLDYTNHIYDANLSEQNYYRETFHTAEYVRRHWSRYFKILDILPGFITPQDLVVAQRM